MKYVIMRGGLYLAAQGSQKSFTSKLEHARVFYTREAAEADKCGNESVCSLDFVMTHSKED